MDWRVGADRDLPIAETERAWDGDAARERIFRWAGWDDDPQPEKARHCFLAYDAENAENKTAYKLPFADIIDGEPKAIPSALRAAASRLPQSDLPADVIDRARGVLDAYFERMNKSEKMRVKVAQRFVPRQPAETQDKKDAVKRFLPWNKLDSTEFCVLGLPFGGPVEGRDADGEAFTQDTEIMLRPGDERPVTYYHGIQQDEPTAIGVARYEGIGAVDGHLGHVFTVRLDPSEPLAQRLTNTNVANIRASSGAVGHLVRVRPDGIITTWPVGELAIFDIDENRRPANDWAVVEVLKADAAKGTSVQNSNDEQGDEEMTQDQEREKDLLDEINQMISTEVDALRQEFKALSEALPGIPAREPATVPAPAVMKAAKPGFSDEPVQVLKRYIALGDEVAAKAILESADGGYLVPDDFLREIIQKRNEQALPFRAGARVITTSLSAIEIPTEATSMAEFAITAEGAAANVNEPGFGQVRVPVYKFTKLVKVSEELLADQQANLERALADMFARAWAQTINKYVITGTGTNQPQGVLAVAPTGVNFASSSSISASEVNNLFYSLPAWYRQSATWQMANGTEGMVRGLQGQPFLFQPSPQGDENMLLGKAVLVTDYMPAVGVNAKSMLIGDWSYYAFVERADLAIRRLNELYAESGVVGILATARFGGAVLQAEAFRVGVHPAV